MTMNKGYVYLPYITSQTISVISSNNPMLTTNVIKSRYGVCNTVGTDYYEIMIRKELLENRRNKLEKIINRINGQTTDYKNS